ncbi:MAG: hypothetical protein A2931_00330 [Candidatus Niyogibacteria bacterium RIFCSPLOWO2_01_FULL_45_48]|uniref:Uncharacterized protein n=2 Tax=Candidatus Niyogiibacteriota TaxID=1817912 RepID=A0A1G2EZK0_9BACT|nr:MAG: hypothetical protein A2931_00330 [Candidatus Niyogibacteria bacterium RIFCSPLOWO2_01_FULL_45_48]OGZ30622.1 MAG: hypothetical protein A2835_03565 [Candidatus Niyogibacteria bacterium RIFCSPHIGHO2_01_FULL_45_28]OGZ31117.1 MAG: hypothetical protein A3J00_03310 [Candidatus Niyogibacteria bacterium RIFCSPLOWO2_02_FULL_45_13]
MKKYFKKLKKKHGEYLQKFLQITTGLAVVLALALIANASWIPPSQPPPNANVSQPLNVSGTTQTKTGKLNFTWFEDQDQPGYYVDPGSNSWLYRLYSYDIRSDIFYDRNNTNYYVDPNSTSVFNTVSLGGVSRSSWPGDIPSGMIAMFSSGCPSGWSRFSALDGRYPRGSSSYGGTGGAETHSHSGTTASAGSHRHFIPYFSWGGNNNVIVGSAASSHNDYVDRTEKYTDYAGDHSHSFNTNSASNIDPYLNMVFCQKN